jgi:DNA-binding GntR family transcriptional regulator
MLRSIIKQDTNLPLSNLAYEYIQRWLVDQRWSTDKRISEQRLAGELGISRTPVREAVRRLVGEGFLYQIPSSGTYIAKPDSKQIIEIYEIRVALEGAAAAKCARTMSVAEISRLLGYANEMNVVTHEFRATGERFMNAEMVQRFVTADMAFHRLIIHAAGNRLAQKIVTEGYLRSRVFGLWSHERDLHHVAWVWLAHTRVARAIQNHKSAAAKHWMQKHIHDSLNDTLTAYTHQQDSQAPFNQVLERLAQSGESILMREQGVKAATHGRS